MDTSKTDEAVVNVLEGETVIEPVPPPAGQPKSSTWPKVSFSQGNAPGSDLTKRTIPIDHTYITAYTESGHRDPAVNNVFYDQNMHKDILELVKRLAYYVCAPDKVKMSFQGTEFAIDTLNMNLYPDAPTDSERWRRDAYEAFKQALFNYNGYVRREVLNNQPNQFGGLAPFPPNRLLRGGAVVPNAGYNGFNIPMKERYDTVLLPITPRLQQSYLAFHDIIDRCYPWGSNIYGRRWFQSPQYIHSAFQAINALSTLSPIPFTLTPYTVFPSLNAGSEVLTYSPFMTDIGNSISALHEEIANSVEGAVRASATMSAVNYMDAAAMITQALNSSSNRATALSALTSTLSNSSASTALVPVVTAMACNFRKIDVAIPFNDQATTILAVLTCLLTGSHIYTTRSIALIHNMAVGLLHRTLMGSKTNQSVIDFAIIKDVTERDQLLSVAHPNLFGNGAPAAPLLPAGAGNQARYANHFALMRLLCHFHGTIIDNFSDAAGAKIFVRPNAPPSNPDYIKAAYSQNFWDIVKTNPLNLPNGYANTSCYHQYFYNFGVIPSRGTPFAPNAPQNGVHTFAEFPSCLPPANGFPNNKLPPSIVEQHLASTFDVLEPQPTIYDGDYNPAAIANMAQPGSANIRVDNAPFPSVALDPNLLPDAANGDACVHVRPIHRGILGYNDGAVYTPNMPSNRQEYTDFLQGISCLAGDKVWSNCGVKDSDFIGPMFRQFLSERFLNFSEYLADVSRMTTLADHSPAGFAPLMFAPGVNIDLNNPLRHRATSRLISQVVLIPPANPIGGGQNAGVNFFSAPVAPGVNPPVVLGGANNPELQVFARMEPQKMVSPVSLSWTSVASLFFLGVRPKGYTNYTHAIDMYYASRALNHDVSVVNYGIRMFRDLYLAPAGNGGFAHPIGAASTSAKIEVMSDVIDNLFSLSPKCSPLTDILLRKSKETDLGNGSVWKGSVFIDANRLDVYDGARLDPTGAAPNNNTVGTEAYAERSRDRVPFLVYKPLHVIKCSDYDGSGLQGAGAQIKVNYSRGCEDLIHHELIRNANVHRANPASQLGKGVMAVIDNKRYGYASDEFRSRPRGATIPSLAGLPYLPNGYLENPYVETNMFRNVPIPFVGNVFDMLQALRAGSRIMDVKALYTRFKKWLAPNSAGHIIDYPFDLKFEEASSIIARPNVIPVPSITAGTYTKIELPIMLYKAGSCINNPEVVLESDTTPTNVNPIVPNNFGPYISRFDQRGPRWPAVYNYTNPGATTENLYYNNAGDNTSMEFNLQLLGSLLAKKTPVMLSEPQEYVKFSVDPLINLTAAS